ncbi:PerC family transcriptional regulator [Salmonella enterica]|nr:PerC family transcriptional regulator [Salmonella enterica]ECE0793447.1 PerC family transcriptional regulator [Salmonella enterica subsp. diarizonae]EHL2773093.1 PerC family transcriptional regulator [Salmonella enterica subsp. enterica serovar Hvittingfoss]EBE9034093.1 PerC family transcriptional regulator [Salmonella enterica]EBE9066601.1 PerC family transcriptional regulator [Salmonella enterica]
MSLLTTVQEFIGLNPGLTSNEIADAFPEYRRYDVQRAASRLYRCKRVNRRLNEDVFRYYAGKDEAVILTLRQKRSGRTGSGDPMVLAKLVSRAEELESKGSFNRAARVWLEAFDESQLTGEREAFLHQRQKCLDRCRKPVRTGEQIYLAGRFVGDVE